MLLQEGEVMIKQTPVGSLPRSPQLQEAFNAFDDGNLKKTFPSFVNFNSFFSRKRGEK